MSNDKTLATAKHGGCVQLGDGLLPCPFCGSPAERIDFGPGAGDNEGGSCVACTRCQASGPVEFGYKENFISNWNRRALSAQPSPGGQDAREQFSDWWADQSTAIGEMLPYEIARLGWQAALAARQPVGEPVANPIHQLRKADGSWVDQDKHSYDYNVAQGHRADLRVVYAAPPAQAVDLGAAIPDTPEVRDILGRPNFWCSPWANVLRMRGDVIPHKAEEEQAAVIRFMLNHYLAHGAAWAETAGAELDAIRKAESKEVAP